MENLSFEIVAELKKLTKGLEEASAKIQTFAQKNEKRLKTFGKNASDIGKKMSLAISLPILALGTASVKAASDFQETESKFNTVFKNISDQANTTAKNLVESFGLSSKAAFELLGNTGDLLTGFGFSQKSALELSNEVNKLAVDLASFTNFSGGAKGASEALTKALLGERESVKSLGISILEADVKAKVLENTQKGLTFETERQAKAYATLQLAQEQSFNAIGDYARTQDSFANQTRLLQARLSDLSVEFGKILLPIAQKLVKAVQSVVSWFSDLDESTKKIIVVVAGLAAAAGPLLIALGTLSSLLPVILSGLAALTGPIGLIIAGIVALGAVIVSNWDTVKQWAEDVANYFIELYNESVVFRGAVELLIVYFKTMWNTAKFVFNALVTIVKTNFKVLEDIFIGLGDVIKDIFTGNFGNLDDSLKKFTNAIANNIGEGLAEITKDAKKLWEQSAEDLGTAIKNTLSNEKLPPVKFDAVVSPESKAKITQDVAEAVNKGAGGNAGATAKDASGQLQQGAVLFNNVNTELEKTPQLIDNLAAKNPEIENIGATWTQLGETLKGVVMDNIANTLSNLGSALGEALATGQSASEALGNSLLQSFGAFLSQLGDMLIQYGLFAKAKGAIDSAVIAGGPISIAAGAAAVAIGVALKGAASAINSRVNSGIGGGGTGANAGGNGINNSFSQSFAAQNEIILRVRGRDLVAVLNNQTNFNNALG